MGVTFEGPAVFVADIAASREFYETILGQAVAADHGPHVAFAGGFSIWQADCALSVIFEDGAVLPEAAGRERFELYFESDDLEAAWERAMADPATGSRAIHGLREHPWGQRGFRLRDPDGHVIEVGEPLAVLVARLMAEGLSLEQVAQKTSIPLEGVRTMAGGGGPIEGAS